MSEHRCSECNRNFANEEALSMHNSSKHSAGIPKNNKSAKANLNLKKIRNWVILLVVALIVFYGIFWAATTGNVTNVDEEELDFTAPSDEIHWHPKLKIIINGKEKRIPENVGITNAAHFPTHTHDDADEGVLHMENSNPTKRTVTLGYFFEVWGKKFSENCIFDYCTNSGNLTMTVNGEKNTEFQNYFMQEGDNIVIEYVSE